jgi:hypothetical protein
MVQWQRPPAGELPPRVQSLGSAQFTRICGLVPTFLYIMLGGRSPLVDFFKVYKPFSLYIL